MCFIMRFLSVKSFYRLCEVSAKGLKKEAVFQKRGIQVWVRARFIGTPAGEGGAGSGPYLWLFPAPLGLCPELRDQAQVESILSQQLPSAASEFRSQGVDRRCFYVLATQSVDCRWVFWNLWKATADVEFRAKE